MVRIATVMLSISIAAACGGKPPPLPEQFAKNHLDGSADQIPDVPAGKYRYDLVSVPPPEYRDAVFALNLAAVDLPSAAAAKVSLWVNFTGATVERGTKLGQSYLVCGTRASIPPSKLNSTERGLVLAVVQQLFDQANTPVVITADAPTSGLYTRIHVGGTYQDLGCTDGQGQVGAAPLDPHNLNASDVAFVFSDAIGDLRAVALTIAHEAGHSFGLEHSTDEHDLMAPMSGPYTETFLAAERERDASDQDSPVLLIDNLSADSTHAAAALNELATPQVTAAVTTTFKNLPDAFKAIPGLDQLAALATALPELTSFQTANLSPIVPEMIKVLPVGIKVPDIEKVLTLVVNGKTPASTRTAPPELTKLPNLIPELGLAKITSFEQLLALYSAQVSVIKANLSGSNKTALISALKLAFSQAYAALPPDAQ